MAFWRPKKSEAELSIEQLQSEAATDAAPLAPSGPFAMTIEDIFVITGRGTVVTGRVATGVVRVGMSATITTMSGSLATTIGGIERFRQQPDEAVAGDNVGLLLENVSRHDVARGDVVRES